MPHTTFGFAGGTGKLRLRSKDDPYGTGIQSLLSAAVRPVARADALRIGVGSDLSGRVWPFS
jgi:uncharacterized spore protein YtfJ